MKKLMKKIFFISPPCFAGTSFGNPKSNIPDWLKLIIVFIGLLIFNFIIESIFGQSYVELILNNLSFIIFIFFLILLYHLVIIYLILLFSKSKNMNIPANYPFFLKYKLEKIKQISNMHPIFRNSIVKMCYINVFIYIFTILILGISLYFI